jgi:protease stability complex PrcB-like protein
VALVVYALWPEREARSVTWHDLSRQTGPLTITRETKRVFRDAEALRNYLAAAGGRAPRVDFERRQVLLVSPGPRSSTGYDLEIVSVREREGNLTVTVRERAPALGDRVAPRVTFPYRLLSLPGGKDVYVSWPGRSPG